MKTALQRNIQAMKNGEKPINPTELLVYGDGAYNSEKFSGLTKREYFAAMAMQGLLSNQGFTEDWEKDFQDGIKLAVISADALLKTLEWDEKKLFM